jgi:sorbitol-specific phosphotransferase system component IIBC
MSFIADHVKALFFAIFFGQSINVSQQISYIGLAFGLVLLYRACRDIVRPHRSLDHIPHVNYFTTMLALVNQEQVSHYSQRVIQPILSKAEGLTLVSIIIRDLAPLCIYIDAILLII